MPKFTSLTAWCSPRATSPTLRATRSPCTTPSACAADSAAPISSAIGSASSSGRRTRASSSVCSERPATHSTTRNGRPSASSPVSRISATCAWRSRLSAASSRRMARTIRSPRRRQSAAAPAAPPGARSRRGAPGGSRRAPAARARPRPRRRPRASPAPARIRGARDRRRASTRGWTARTAPNELSRSCRMHCRSREHYWQLALRQ